MEFEETLRAPADAAKEPLETRLAPVETLLGSPGRTVVFPFEPEGGGPAGGKDADPEYRAGLERDAIIVPVSPIVEEEASICMALLASFTEPKLIGDVLVDASFVRV